MHLRALKELATIISEKLQQSWSSLGYLLKAGILKDGTVRSPASLTAEQNKLKLTDDTKFKGTFNRLLVRLNTQRNLKLKRKTKEAS